MEKKMKHDFFEEERKNHYDTADKNDKLIFNFRDINHTIRSLYEGRGSQKRILIILLEAGTITQRKLTAQLGIQPGSASEILAKLEKGGLIVRSQSPEDRRTTDITLTAQGKELAEEARTQRKGRHEEMFSCLKGDEKDMLLTLLEKINADWKNRYKSSENLIHGKQDQGGKGHQGSGEGHRNGGEGHYGSGEGHRNGGKGHHSSGEGHRNGDGEHHRGGKGHHREEERNYYGEAERQYHKTERR